MTMPCLDLCAWCLLGKAPELTMGTYLWPVLFTIFAWWFGTGVILFLNQCIGLPPDTWFKNASPYLFEDPTEFTRFILTDVNQYNIFYPTNSWGDSAVFKSYILKSSSFNHSIANAKKLAKELEKSGLYSKTWIDDSRTFLLTRALAYVILTGDDEKLMSNWND